MGRALRNPDGSAARRSGRGVRLPCPSCCGGGPEPRFGYVLACRCSPQVFPCDPPPCIYIRADHLCTNSPIPTGIVLVPGGGCYEVQGETIYCECPPNNPTPQFPCTRCIPPGSVVLNANSYECRDNCTQCPPIPETFAPLTYCDCSDQSPRAYLSCRDYWRLLAEIHTRRLSGELQFGCLAMKQTFPGFVNQCWDGVLPPSLTTLPLGAIEVYPTAFYPAGCCQCCEPTSGCFGRMFQGFHCDGCQRVGNEQPCCCSEPGSRAEATLIGEEIVGGQVCRRYTERTICDGTTKRRVGQTEFFCPGSPPVPFDITFPISGVCGFGGLDCATDSWPPEFCSVSPGPGPCSCTGRYSWGCYERHIAYECIDGNGNGVRNKGDATMSGSKPECEACNPGGIIIGNPGGGGGGGGLIVPSRNIIVPGGCSGCGGDGGL